MTLRANWGFLILVPLATLACRTKGYNETSSEILNSGSATTANLQTLLGSNTDSSRQQVIANLKQFRLDLDGASEQDNPSSELPLLRTSAEVLLLKLSQPDKDICEESEKITFYRGLPRVSLNSLNPSEAVIVGRGFNKTQVSFADVMRNYARRLDDPAAFGNQAPVGGSKHLDAIPPFSFQATSSRHSLAVAAPESPYISVTVSPGMAKSFTKEGGYIATLKLCPARMWSTAEGGFASEGEFLIPFGTLPGEITELSPVSESGTNAILSLPPSKISKCFFENPGVGDTGIYKATSVKIVTELNALIFRSLQGASGSFESFAAIDFNPQVDGFIKEKCNCAHQVKVFTNLAKARNEDNAKSGFPPTWTPGDDFCDEFFSE